MTNQNPFQLGRKPYVAVVQRPDVATTRNDPVHLGIYAPGTCCHYWRDHRQRAATCYYLYLAWDDYPGAWVLTGTECLQYYFPAANQLVWRVGLDQRQASAGAGLAVNWREETRREYWALVRLMGLLLQIEPDLGILRGYIHRATGLGKRPFTPKEKEWLLAQLRQRGGTVRALGKGDAPGWRRERAAHYRVLQRRRDLAFRLARLGALELSGSDQDTVRSLAACNIRLEAGRLGILTKSPEQLVGALAAQYFEQRQRAAAALAGDLAREFQIEIPQWSRWSPSVGATHAPGIVGEPLPLS